MFLGRILFLLSTLRQFLSCSLSRLFLSFRHLFSLSFVFLISSFGLFILALLIPTLSLLLILALLVFALFVPLLIIALVLYLLFVLGLLGNSVLRIEYGLVVHIQLSHHFHETLLLLHHLGHDLVEQVLRLLRHPQSLDLPLNSFCLFQHFLTHFSPLYLVVFQFGFFASGHQFLPRPYPLLVEVVPPLSVLGVVLVFQHTQWLLQLLEERVLRVAVHGCQGLHKVRKEVYVVYLLLRFDVFQQQGPEVLVEKLQGVQVGTQFGQETLVVSGFGFPFRDQDGFVKFS